MVVCQWSCKGRRPMMARSHLAASQVNRRRGQGAADHARKPQGARPGAAGFSRRSWFNFELRQTGLFWLRSTMNLA